ncbi:hypothetical protein GW17_00037655 [Ensete ventricosum]|nr:hypothetical protein GW17_00037655 [Ensete ventricosum]
MDGQLVKIRQTSTVQEYQSRFEHLSNQTQDYFSTLEAFLLVDTRTVVTRTFGKFLSKNNYFILGPVVFVMHDNHTSMKNEDGVTKDYKLICLSSTWMRHSLPALPRLRLGGQDVDDEQASRLWRRRNRLGSPDGLRRNHILGVGAGLAHDN